MLAELKPVIFGIGSTADYTDDAYPTTGRRHDPASVPAVVLRMSSPLMLITKVKTASEMSALICDDWTVKACLPRSC